MSLEEPGSPFEHDTLRGGVFEKSSARKLNSKISESRKTSTTKTISKSHTILDINSENNCIDNAVSKLRRSRRLSNILSSNTRIIANRTEKRKLLETPKSLAGKSRKDLKNAKSIKTNSSSFGEWKFDFEDVNSVNDFEKIHHASPIQMIANHQRSLLSNTPNLAYNRIFSNSNLSPDVIPIEELCVHPKKINEVNEWLKKIQKPVSNPLGYHVLMIKGPSGSGKTSCVNSLCSSNGIRVVNGFDLILSSKKYLESKSSPLSLQRTRFPPIDLNAEIDLEEYSGNSDSDISLFSEDFSESMLCKSQISVILIDNLPNIEASPIISSIIDAIDLKTSVSSSNFSSHPNLSLIKNNLHEIINVIMILTDPSDGSPSSNDSHKKSEESRIWARLSQHPCIEKIIFNPISSTLLKRLDLKTRKSNDNFHGDLRSAIISDHLIRMHSSSINGKNDLTFSFHHKLGKILYPRGGDKDKVDASLLTETDRPLFQAYLHHNYPRFLLESRGLNAQINAMCLISDAFSLNDAIDWTVRNQSHHESSLPEISVVYAINLCYDENCENSVKRVFNAIDMPHFINYNRS